MRVVAVSEVTRYLHDLLEEDYNLQDLWIRGEVTNYSQSSAGHRYFTLKDETAILKCVMFGGRGAYGAQVPIANGMAALAHGHMSVYEARGECQLYVDSIEDAGLGALQRRFDAMKARLDAEGLFADERKRPLPTAPRVVGVVTSLAAAALRDIVRTLTIRAPLMRVIIAPAAVQGIGAGEQIADAIAALNTQGAAEVIIVARGGGSLEELWAFNEEEVARAIAQSRLPVVTGVGHESDFTIADLVADQRASTPTAAATLVAPDQTQARAELLDRRLRLDAYARWVVEEHRDALRQTTLRLTRLHPSSRIAASRARAAHAGAALERAFGQAARARGEHLHSIALRLDALSPLRTLARGYAIVRQAATNAVISSMEQAEAGRRLRIQFADGSIDAIAGMREFARADVAERAGDADDPNGEAQPWAETRDQDAQTQRKAPPQ